MKHQDVIQNYAEVFAALGDPMRLDILSRMAKTDELACTVLDDALPVSKSTISYHIKVLYHAGLIQVRKEGRFYFYTLKKDVLDQLLPGFYEKLLSMKVSEKNKVRKKQDKQGLVLLKS